MFPPDEWLELLNFYLIVNSGGKLTLDDFGDVELQAAWLEHPGTAYTDMDPAAVKLVLEFQAKAQDTEGKKERMKDEGGRMKISSLHPSSF
ncbi:MAG: hypothetical protein DPW09_33325 [Anaerolineae bacterium]|nr:hypothetical protein [Anaerolineae bacterium]